MNTFNPETRTVNNRSLMNHTSNIVSAYVANNPVSYTELQTVIADTHKTLEALADNKKPAGEPPVSIKKSLQDDYLICLEDGKKFKSLKRHLRSHYDLSPEEYREKWGLPHDYPMVAPNYTKARSQLARDMGLGRKPGQKIKKKANLSVV